MSLLRNALPSLLVVAGCGAGSAAPTDAAVAADSDADSGPPPCAGPDGCATLGALSCNDVDDTVRDCGLMTVLGCLRWSAPVSCGDGNVCTADACDPEQGCHHEAGGNECNDKNGCTSADHCEAGQCVGGPPTDCNDGNPCTDDACKAPDGCVHSANGAGCDDGDLCTTKDACADKGCHGGPVKDCDDADPCTVDACDAKSGCSHTAVSPPCP